jgi:hypothetical protein
VATGRIDASANLCRECPSWILKNWTPRSKSVVVILIVRCKMRSMQPVGGNCVDDARSDAYGEPVAIHNLFPLGLTRVRYSLLTSHRFQHYGDCP